MLTISNGKIIYGVAGTTAVIDYTIMGKLRHLSDEPATLAQGQLTDSSVALYSPGSDDKVMIDTIILTNTSAVDVTGVKILVHTRQISPSMTIPADGTAIYDGTGWHVQTPSGGSLVQVTGVTQSGSIWLDAGRAYKTTTDGGLDVSQNETTTNLVNTKYLACHPDTSMNYCWEFALPKDYNGGTMTAQFVWTGLATALTTNVAWNIQGLAYANGDTSDNAWGDSKQVIDANVVGKKNISSATAAITLAGAPAADQMAVIRAFREAASTLDTLDAFAGLHGIVLTYTKAVTV